MDKDGVLTISDWTKGMAKHPIQGIGLFRNADIVSNPGILSIAPKTELNFTPNGLPVAFQLSDSGDIYTLTQNGSNSGLYKNGTAIDTNLSSGKDLIIFEDYLLVTHGNKVGAYGPLSTSPQWFSDLSVTISNPYEGQMLNSLADSVYISNGNTLAELSFSASGTVGVAPTATFTADVVDLPEGDYITSLANLGRYVAIGTQTGSSRFSSSNKGKVYTWNRSTETSRLAVVEFNENRVHQIYSHANRLYVLAGAKGNLYITDGANYTRIKQIPFTEISSGATLYGYPNAISLSQEGRLLIGTSTNIDVHPDSSSKHGVWEVDISTEGYPITLKNTISTGNYGQDTPLSIGAIGSISQTRTEIGWADGASFGVDKTNSTVYADYGAQIESQFVQVGKKLSPKTFQHIEWTLSNPLTSGQAVRISYRKNLGEAWTEIGDWTFADLGAVISHQDNASIQGAEFLQLKVELDDNGTSAGSNVDLIRVQLW